MAEDVSAEQFARELLNAARKTSTAAERVTKKGANNVKQDAKRNVQMTAPVHNARAHQTINYDVKAEGALVEAEIGYDKTKRGGALGNLLEFGGGGDHSPPHHDLARALAAEASKYEDALADMGEALISGAVEATMARLAPDGAE